MEIIDSNFSNLRGSHGRKEGIVLLGCGGELGEWVDGVSRLLKEEGITETNDPNRLWSGAFKLTTTGGRIDLFLVFSDNRLFHIGKMAIWRLKFGNCSWWSDYIFNYAEHHGVRNKDEDKEKNEQ